MGVGLASTFLRDDVSVTEFVPIVLLPRLSMHKGLPADFDIGLSYTGDLKSDDFFYFKLLAAEIRYAMLEDTPATPGLAMRGSYSNLLGIDGFNFDTRTIDLTISKAWGRKAKPYAGIGQVWVNSTPKNITINGIPLKSENLNLTKMFAGINLNFGLTNIDFEADRTGSFNSYSFKVAFRF
jgi:hypothetical protein